MDKKHNWANSIQRNVENCTSVYKKQFKTQLHVDIDQRLEANFLYRWKLNLREFDKTSSKKQSSNFVKIVFKKNLQIFSKKIFKFFKKKSIKFFYFVFHSTISGHSQWRIRCLTSQSWWHKFKISILQAIFRHSLRSKVQHNKRHFHSRGGQTRDGRARNSQVQISPGEWNLLRSFMLI